jgi:hypothetical protein
MFTAYGSESSIVQDGNSGGVSHIAYDMNGVHYLGAAGFLRATNAYNYSSTNIQDVKDFWTPNSSNGYCQTSPGWNGG